MDARHGAPTALLFADELDARWADDLAPRVARGGLALTDHNKLSGSLRARCAAAGLLGPPGDGSGDALVRAVVDHHRDEGLHRGAPLDRMHASLPRALLCSGEEPSSLCDTPSSLRQARRSTASSTRGRPRRARS